MSEWELYFLLKLDDIHGFLIAMSILAGFVTAFAVIIIALEEKWGSLWKILPIISTAIMFSFALTATILPSTKQMVAIMVAPKIINNEKVQELPNEILDLLGMSIDKAKEALKGVENE